MRIFMVFLFSSVSLGSFLYGEDLVIPLHDGSILIQQPTFIRDGVPALSFTATNRTSSPWKTIKLQFDIGGLCDGKPRQWMVFAVVSLGWMKDLHVSRPYRDLVIPLIWKVDGCNSEIINAKLVFAENDQHRVDGAVSEPVDFTERLKDIARVRAVAAAEEAERRRIAAEKQAKEDAVAAAALAKLRKQVEAAAEAERRRMAATCRMLYAKTSDKKVGDLTVKEAQLVQACQSLGLYVRR